MIPVTPEEAKMLASAMTAEADLLHSIAEGHPLRSQDPTTQRYGLMDAAYNLRQRARALRIQATDEIHERTTDVTEITIKLEPQEYQTMKTELSEQAQGLKDEFNRAPSTVEGQRHRRTLSERRRILLKLIEQL